MANLMKDSERISRGTELNQIKGQVQTAFGRLDQIKAQLAGLKSSMSADNNFTADDVAAVDSVITYINTKYSG